MNKPQIQDLCEFKNIRRTQILDDCCKNIIDDNKEYIFSNHFSKTKCKIYNKNILNAHFSIFKSMLQQVRHTLLSKTKFTMKDGVRTHYTVYYIEKRIYNFYLYIEFFIYIYKL